MGSWGGLKSEDRQVGSWALGQWGKLELGGLGSWASCNWVDWAVGQVGSGELGSLAWFWHNSGIILA